MSLSGKTVFVTGGSGFIGGRAIETLVRDHGARVRTLVRSSSSAGGGAFRAAATGAEIVFGSLLDQDLLDRELAGADIVLHCAYGMHGTPAEQREVTVEGTRRLARAAVRNRIGQFVHLGSVTSYGGKTPDVVPEDYDSPALWPWPYARDKLDAEAALAAEAGAGALPNTVIRLAAVYGPYGGSHTVIPLMTMRTRRWAMVDGGVGFSGATYVDDAIQAMLRAALRPGNGRRYMVLGPDQPTWGEFYKSYASMLRRDVLVTMSSAEMRAAWRGQRITSARRLIPATLHALKASREFKDAAAGLGLRTAYQKLRKAPLLPAPGGRLDATDEMPVQLVPPMMIDYFANRSCFSTARAEAELGYAPRYNLSRGMTLTEQWARWADLIP